MSVAALSELSERAGGRVSDLRERVGRLGPAQEQFAVAEKSFAPLALIAVVLLAAVPLFNDSAWTLRLQDGMAFGLLCISLNILVGTTGLITFGHAMFWGVGGYMIAIPFRDHGINPLYLLALTPVAGALCAFLVGLVVLRGKAIYFSLLTLGFAQLFWAVWHGWQSMTGGTNGIFGVFVPGALNGTTNPNNIYWFIFGCTVFTTGVVYVITRSPLGDAFRAVRDNPRRAEYTGMAVRRYELLAFVIAGSVGAIAGGLSLLSATNITSGNLTWSRSTIALIAALIGGTRYFLGPLFGAIVYIYLFDTVAQTSGTVGTLWQALLGVIVLAVALAFPGGIVGLVHLLLAYGVGIARKLRGVPLHAPERPHTAAVMEAVQLPEVGEAFAPAGIALDAPIVLEVTGLTKRFGGLVAVNDASLTVRKGAIHAIIGPNGAGKSTFFNLVTGLYKPDAGTVLLDGVDVTGQPSWRLIKRGMGRSFQQTNLFWTLSSELNLTVAGSAVQDSTYKPYGSHPQDIKERTADLLARMGLSAFARLPASQLSHGDQRSLEIATALAVNSTILMLDEPTAGLSPPETRVAVALIQKIARDRGLTVVFVEHDMEVVFAIADRITVLHRGSVLAEGTPEEIRRNQKVREAYLGEDFPEGAEG